MTFMTIFTYLYAVHCSHFDLELLDLRFYSALPGVCFSSCFRVAGPRLPLEASVPRS
jgi:hypothetical protein